MDEGGQDFLLLTQEIRTKCTKLRQKLKVFKSEKFSEKYCKSKQTVLETTGDSCNPNLKENLFMNNAMSRCTILKESQESCNISKDETESKQKRQHRQKSKDVDSIYKTSDLVLNCETFLILDLLALPEEERQDFLIKLAKHRNILVHCKDTNSFDLHPKIKKLNDINVLTRPTWNFSNVQKKQLMSVARSLHKSDNDPAKKDKTRPILEDLINAVVWEGLSEEQKAEFTLPTCSKKIRSNKNYFYGKVFTDQLEAFAQKCVEAKLGLIVEGEIRVNAKNNDQAFMKHVHCEKDAMFTSLIIRKCALNGDIVRAFVRLTANGNTKEGGNDCSELFNETIDDEENREIIPERSSKGFVIRIVQNVHNRKCVGNFLSYRLDSDCITFMPRDMRLPNIKIHQKNWPKTFTKDNMQNIQNDLYEAAITDWIGDICTGKILKAVGQCGDLRSEYKAILLQNNLDVTPFNKNMDELFYGPLVITNEEREKREDLSSQCIFTIDPLTARDLDDALSCSTLSNGNYEIGVHISDVSFFIEENSELDEMIKQRTTSVYMVDEVYHMIPKPLCMKCSLLPGQEKLTYSVFWEISPEGDVLQTYVTRSIIKSCTQLAYEHAQVVLDNPQQQFTEKDFPTIYNGFTASDIVERIKILQSLATVLRQKRFDKGALKINRPKLYFSLHLETGQPIAFHTATMDTANYLIEEFMLLANQTVAELIYSKFPDISILRNHSPPNSNAIKKLKNNLSSLGLDLNISSSKSIYESLTKIINSSQNKEAMDVCLSHLVSKPMKRAEYICSDAREPEEFRHFALSIPIYTHFTSPIRRYPDVLVHRVLSAALGYLGPPKRSVEELHEIATLCNDHKYNAKMASEDCANLYFIQYVKSNQPLVLRAAVLDVWRYSMEVILIKTGHIIRIAYPKEQKSDNSIEVSASEPNTSNSNVLHENYNESRKYEKFSEILVELHVEKNKLKGKLAASQNDNPQKVEAQLINTKRKKRTKTKLTAKHNSNLTTYNNGHISGQMESSTCELPLNETVVPLTVEKESSF